LPRKQDVAQFALTIHFHGIIIFGIVQIIPVHSTKFVSDGRKINDSTWRTFLQKKRKSFQFSKPSPAVSTTKCYERFALRMLRQRLEKLITHFSYRHSSTFFQFNFGDGSWRQAEA